MNEQLQGKLVEILTEIQVATKTAGDYAIEQLPDIVQSYVLYGRVSNAAFCIFLLAMSGVFGGFARWAYKNPWGCTYHSGKSQRADSNEIFIVMSSLFAFVFVMIATFSFNWLVWLAPKVWILKELASLVRT